MSYEESVYFSGRRLWRVDFVIKKMVWNISSVIKYVRF